MLSTYPGLGKGLERQGNCVLDTARNHGINLFLATVTGLMFVSATSPKVLPAF